MITIWHTTKYFYGPLKFYPSLDEIRLRIDRFRTTNRTHSRWHASKISSARTGHTAGPNLAHVHLRFSISAQSLFAGAADFFSLASGGAVITGWAERFIICAGLDVASDRINERHTVWRASWNSFKVKTLFQVCQFGILLPAWTPQHKNLLACEENWQKYPAGQLPGVLTTQLLVVFVIKSLKAFWPIGHTSSEKHTEHLSQFVWNGHFANT